MEKQQLQPIKFYRKNETYGFFSNFYPSPMQQNNIKYTTNEHYFQSKKFEGNPYELQVAQAQKPNQAFKMGQTRQIPLRDDWNDVKEKVMMQGLRLKFTQNQELKQKFLATGDREIIQHTDNDHYWGDGLGKGKNRLGVLLMNLRQELRKQQKK